jgi:RND superfamily putative drug exporter
MDHSSGRFLTSVARLSTAHPGWVVVIWLAVVAGLNLGVPQLEKVVADDSTAVVPPDAPSVVATEEMDDIFGSGRSTSFVFVAVEREDGLTGADRRWFRGLVPILRADTDHVSFVQDVTARPGLLEALTSRDGEAMYLQVGIPGATGAPAAIAQISAIRDTVRTNPPPGLTVEVTGPAATISDLAVEVEHSVVRITIVTIGLIALILLCIYRSLAVTALVLTFVGLSLAAARAATALAGLRGVFDVSTFTGSFLTAVVLGAATDYAIFLVSRYHEQRRLGVPARESARMAGTRISSVIVGSALTVVIANACMALADVGLFRTTGPAIAVSVAVTLAMSLTLVPALMVLAGERGVLDPRDSPDSRRRSRGGRGWERLAGLVVATPGRVLVAGLVPLLLLAGFYPVMQSSHDQRVVQPAGTESNRGYALLARHFPLNEVLPDYVLIQADHDLRNAQDLATLEQAAAGIARIEDVVAVRGVTRPLGTPIEQASVGYQAGQVGQRLDRAGSRVEAGSDDAQRLVDGSGRLESGAAGLADGTGRLAGGADRAVTGAGRLLDGLDELHTGVARLADGAREAQAGGRRLREGASALAAGLETAYSQTRVAVDGLGMAAAALDRSVTCGLDPTCVRARAGVRQVYVGERDRLLPGLRQAATAARRIADGTTDLDAGLAQLEDGLDRARAGVTGLEAGQRTLRGKLGELADGADRLDAGTGLLAVGADQVHGGTSQLADSVSELGGGLDRAATYLRRTGRVAADPAIGGFYLPPAALDDPRLTAASGLFLSSDGRTARLVVLGGTDSFGHAASERSVEVREAALDGLRDTRLAGSDVSVTGMAGINHDLEEFATSDFTLVAGVALVAVFLILLWLLRSLVAATFLLASVVLSYAAAVGLGVLVWQVLLDRPLDWSVPTIAFILLVAVGADYNLLLTKRMHEEAPDGSRDGIARAVTATGGVITSAGVIFAASMFALMAGSVTTLAQTGFTIGMGLLLDTFVVRSLVVPSFAALMGPRLWWPSKPTPAPDPLR